jgi:outer membrane lipoprotein-sorting protein
VNNSGNILGVLLASLALCFLSGGCAVRSKARIPAPEESPVPLNSEAALKSFASRIKANEGAEGFARLNGSFRNNKEKFSASAAILVKKPSLFYLELSGPFGRSGLKLAADGTNISAFFVQKKRFLSEPFSPELAEDLLGIRLYPEEIVSLLIGEGIPLEKYSPIETSALTEEKVFRIVCNSEQLKRKAVLLLDSESPRVLKGTFFDSDKEIPVASFQFTYKGSSVLPQGLEITSLGEQCRIRFRYRYLKFSNKIQSSSFQIRIPKSADRIERTEVSGSRPFLFLGNEE